MFHKEILFSNMHLWAIINPSVDLNGPVAPMHAINYVAQDASGYRNRRGASSDDAEAIGLNPRPDEVALLEGSRAAMAQER